MEDGSNDGEPPLDAERIRVWNRTETHLEVLAFPKEPGRWWYARIADKNLMMDTLQDVN